MEGHPTPRALQGYQKPPFESYPVYLPAKSSLLGANMHLDLNKAII